MEAASITDARGLEPGVDRQTASSARERLLPVVLVAVAVGVVVTLATNSLQLLRAPAQIGLAWSIALRAFGILAATAGLTWLLAERKRVRATAPGGSDPAFVGLRTAATIMGAVTLLALLNPPPRTPRGGGLRVPSLPIPSPFGADKAPGPRMEARTRGGDPLIRGDPTQLSDELIPVRSVGPANGLVARMRLVLPYILLLVLMWMVIASLARKMRRPHEVELATPLAPADAEAGLDASLSMLITPGDDPRGQITHAYHRLLAALAAAGAPREPHEAPHEHLHRALGPLGVRPEPLHRLTGLYVLAHFGGRPVTEHHRTDAADALEASLAHLRGSA